MISLAAQKFVSDIANDALQHCKMRGSGQSSRKSGKVSFKTSLICAVILSLLILMQQTRYYSLFCFLGYNLLDFVTEITGCYNASLSSMSN